MWSTKNNSQSTPIRYAWLTVWVSIITVGLKLTAFSITNSVALFSDGIESVVNIVTAVTAVASLLIAAQPPDAEHAYGHTKAEYFASFVTGGAIFAAAISIAWAAIGRWQQPTELVQINAGIILIGIATAVNLWAGQKIQAVGKRTGNSALQAEGKHLMSDVWTSIGVTMGVWLVWLTQILWLDALIALLVAIQLGYAGAKIIYEAVSCLLDRALPEEELEQVTTILNQYRKKGVEYHALRSRQAGAHRFVSVHLQVPGSWTVQASHELADQIEAELRAAVPRLSPFTHVEPIEDPRSWEDIDLRITQ